MLKIEVKATEYYDEATNTFFNVEPKILSLEHSLKSLYDWESKHKKRFLEASEKQLTPEETFDYIKCMTLNEEPIPDETYYAINGDDVKRIFDYIQDPMTATTFYDFKKQPKKGKNEKISAEIIYYWMLQAGVPFECENWHLNRLLTLLRVCSIKGNNGKMSKRETAEFNRALMAERRGKK